MADHPNLAPKEAQTTGGSSSAILLPAEVKNRFQVKDCSIKLEIVDTEAMMMTSPAITEEQPKLAAAENTETAESEKTVESLPAEKIVTMPVAPEEIKYEPVPKDPIVADSSHSKDSALSSARKTSNGSLPAHRTGRKRPRKVDPSGKSRDSSEKPRDPSGKSRDISAKHREPVVKPRRPSPNKSSSRPKKPKRRFDGYLDEMTTHSETSENLFSEINWEENLDCDTSALVDEFAPRPTKPVKTKTAEIKTEEHAPPVPIIPIPPVVEVVEPGTESPMTAQEFRPGTKISVLDYKTSTWNHGTVTEVDWEENEVLIIYDDRSKEWVSMSSQRLSRCNSNESGLKDDPVEPISSDYLMPFEEKPVTLPTPKLDSSSRISSGGGLAARKRARARSSGSGGGGSSRSRKDRKRKRTSQQTSSPASTAPSRSSSGLAIGQDGPMSDDKFEVGEKVLAKWSDFRMQKFPAIIKKIAGKGLYDLLFYDGFEKTIRAENVFKTTEEEVAKYKRTNPSEADVFVDIDADSKEARRQRKKKSFGDSFLSASEYPRKRSFGGHLPPHAMTPVRSDSGASSGLSIKQSERLELPQFASTAKRSRQSRRSNEEAPSTSLEEAESVGVTHEPLRVEESLRVKERVLDRERFLGDIPEGARPLKISLPDSDVFQTTVVMPDKRLPPGWAKHCVKREGAWKAFLLSPDRFKITNRAELAEYAHKMLRSKSPKKISFQFLEEIIPDLIEKQKDLEPTEDFQLWIRRKSMKKPKLPSSSLPSAAVQPSGPDIPQTGLERDPNLASLKLQGGVKTLLPKYRAPVSVPLAQAATVQPDDSDVTGLLKCMKEGCDKKFRKESLLHMHLKHYHEEEFRKIVMMAPRVDELASARTESGYKADSPIKPSPPSLKKPIPKLSPQTPDAAKTDYSPTTPIPHPASEEKKTTIKTLLPRQSTSQDSVHQLNAETMEVETVEDEFSGQAAKSRMKKPKLEPQVGSALAELGYPQLAPPPPGLKHVKKKLPSIDKTEGAVVDEGKASPSYETTDDGVLIERLRSEELINCICGFREEDGLMIQCDICMCWQHGVCSGMMTDSDVPERYVCYICRNPPKVRSSQKYSYALHYLTQGKLARKKDENDLKQREAITKKCFDILGSVHNMKNVECSLRAKLNIAQRSDHPKLYLWAKNWETQNKNVSDPINDQSGSRIPVPEAPIDLDECRSRLLDHIDSYIEQLDTRLNTIHSQLLVLDSQDDSSEPSDSDKLTKKVLYAINKDLMCVKKLAKLE